MLYDKKVFFQSVAKTSRIKVKNHFFVIYLKLHE